MDIASSTASERCIPCGCGFPTAMATSTMAASSSITPITKSSVISHLHLDQPGHPERADAEQQCGARSITQPMGSVNIGMT